MHHYPGFKIQYHKIFTLSELSALLDMAYKRWQDGGDTYNDNDAIDDAASNFNLNSLAISNKRFISKYPERVDQIIRYFFDSVLHQWQGGYEKNEVSELIIKLLPFLNKLKSKSPFIQLDTNRYSVVYRGNQINGNKLASFMKRTDPSDWRRVPIGENFYFIYTVKHFPYKPHRQLQSWTIKDEIADTFAKNSILATKANKTDFYFNPKFFKDSAFQNEAETIHYGTNLKVILGIEANVFEMLSDVWPNRLSTMNHYSDLIKKYIGKTK